MSKLQIKEEILNNQQVRSELTKESHLIFFTTYFADYIEYEFSDLHRDLFRISELNEESLSITLSFRGSAKSTLMTLSYPVWAILGRQQKKFVLIVCQTQYQAKMHLTNIKRELEGNELLRHDLGPFTEKKDEWGASSLYLSKYGAKITAISAEQSMRGIRNRAYRPDLIIADDVEDLQSVTTKEGRKKTYDWFTGEILGSGDLKTKTIVIGNLLHEDSLLMRLKDDVEFDRLEGSFTEWPIVKNGKPTWPGKYPDKQALLKQKRMIANPIAWEREFMLNLVSDDEQIINRKMIKYYDHIPVKAVGQERRTVVGVDLAIAQHGKADYTAILTLEIIGSGKDERMYVHPGALVKRFNFHTIVEALKMISDAHSGPRMYIESVAFQVAVVQELDEEGFDAVGVTPTSSKYARLSAISNRIINGDILFPKKGAELLIDQIVGFGIEKHDDLVDALTIAVLEYRKEQRANKPGKASWVKYSGGMSSRRR